MSNNSNTNAVNLLIKRKKETDLLGLQNAKRQGKLKEYLRRDLLAIGIDPNQINFTNFLQNEGEIGDILLNVSCVLDETFYVRFPFVKTSLNSFILLGTLLSIKFWSI